MQEPGFLRNITTFGSGFAALLRARLQLAGLESKEALVHYAVVLGLLAGGLGAVLLGYIFLCLCVAFLLAWAFGGGNAWIWVTLGLALVHFAGAAGLLFWAKGKLTAPMFTATLDELRKDQEWLTALAAKSS